MVRVHFNPSTTGQYHAVRPGIETHKWYVRPGSNFRISSDVYVNQDRIACAKQEGSLYISFAKQVKSYL